MPQSPSIIAHRGASVEAPENTIRAFLLAFMQGADGIEADIRLTGDGHLVAVHDADMKRTGKRTLKVARASLEELRTMDVGKWKGRQSQGQLVPTLEEIMALTPAGKLLFLDIKSGAEAAPALAKALKDGPLKPAQVRLLSPDPALHLELKALLPRWHRLLLCKRRWSSKDGDWRPAAAYLISSALALDVRGVALDSVSALGDEGIGEALNKDDLEFHVWTVNGRKMATRTAALGVTSIITDYAGRLVDTLRGQS